MKHRKIVALMLALIVPLQPILAATNGDPLEQAGMVIIFTKEVIALAPKAVALAQQWASEVKKGANPLFPGIIERGIKSPPLFRIITKEDLSPFVDAAAFFGQTYTPQDEVIVDLTNQNIDTIAQVEARITKAQKDVQTAINKIDADILALDAQKAYAASTPEEEVGAESFIVDARKDLVAQKEAKQKYLASINDKNITCFRLGRNYITEVKPNAFKRFPSVKLIDLGSNQIKIVQKGAFANLTKLQVLILSDNPLGLLPTNAFKNDTSLKLLAVNPPQIPSASTPMTGLPGVDIANMLSNKIASQIMLKCSENIKQLQKALPKTHITTLGINRSNAIISIKYIGVAVLAVLFATYGGSLTKLFGINLPKGASSRVIAFLISKKLIETGANETGVNVSQ